MNTDFWVGLAAIHAQNVEGKRTSHGGHGGHGGFE
jgi:hypothetical protein